MSEITRSPLIVQKEQELKQLQQQHKKVSDQLKKQKQKLESVKTEIVELQRKGSEVVVSKMEAMQQLIHDLVAIAQEISKSKRFTKHERNEAREFAKEFGQMDDYEEHLEQIRQAREEAFEYFKAEREQNENGEYAKFNFFEEFAVKLPEEEQRNVRKIFLRLATKFHPDKATTPRETEHFNSIMQRINQAYEQGDIATLLDIEKQYVDYSSEQFKEATELEGLLQWIDKEIKRLDDELNLLSLQLERTKLELKNIERSDVGKMRKQNQTAAKRGEDMDTMLVEMDNSLTQLMGLRDILKEFLTQEIWDNQKLEKYMRSSGMMNNQLQQAPLFDNDDTDLSPEELALLMDMLFGGEEIRPRKRRKR